MNPSARRARLILRVARRGPFGKNLKTEPVEHIGKDGKPFILHRLIHDPLYTNRNNVYWEKGISWKTKAGQRWLKETAKAARWDACHATSDCCGWGNGEVYHDPYVYTGTDLVPRRNRLQPPPAKD